MTNQNRRRLLWSGGLSARRLLMSVGGLRARRSTGTAFLITVVLLLSPTAHAQDAIVAGVNVDRLDDGNGGGASVLWIHPRASDTFVAGATFLALPDARWAWATLGGTRRLSLRTTLNADANLGGGSDDRGGFRYVIVRGGVTHELIARRLYGEAEWLQTDVARQQDGIARIGATFVALPHLTFRSSLFQSIAGDNDITLATVRADYDLGRYSVLGGFSGGTSIPALLQQTGDAAVRVREAFGGITFGNDSRRWTVLLTTLSSSGEDRQRLTVSCRVPLRARASRTQ